MGHRSRFTGFIELGLWLAVIAISALALWGTRPPPAVDASAPANLFSAGRAIKHLEHIAKQPHPIGSDEAVRVREYLIEQLRGLGAEVHIEQGIGSVSYGRTVQAGLVNNLVATFPGQANSRAIMLVAHYDSVPEGPGAADDGAGLIVILETIRALRLDPPLKNDLVVLFSDGEEARGLLGAQAFVAGHPDVADRIGLLVNLEARGTSGPGLMFETSNDNGALIREFARAAPYPMATSLMAAIYKLLPNDTDFTPLKATGVTGLNFAFIETHEGYHTRLDTIENLDPRSVQHIGANVLGLVRHFGNLSLPLTKERDLVYFNWFGTELLVYPVWFAWAVALLAPILFAFAGVRFARRLNLTMARIAAGFGIFFLQLLILWGGSVVAFAIAHRIAGELLEGDTLSNQLLFAAVTGIGLGLALISQRLFVRKLGLANLAAGQLVAVSLLSLLLCWFLVGGSYVLQGPLVLGMAALFFSDRLTEPLRSVCQLGFAIPAFLVFVPLAYMFFVALTFNIAALAAAAFLFTSLLAVALPLFEHLRSRFSVVIIFLSAAVLIGAGIRLTKRSAAHPRRNSLVYSVNADEKKAKWISYDAAPDAWTSAVLGSAARSHADPGYTAGLERPVFSNDATFLPLTSPQVTVAQDTTAEGVRTVRLQISSTRGARLLLVRVPFDVALLAAGWNGKVEPIHDNSRTHPPCSLRFYNAPPEGASVELRFRAQNPIQIWVADTTPELPAIAPLLPRPNDTTPAYGSDVTLVAKLFEF